MRRADLVPFRPLLAACLLGWGLFGAAAGPLKEEGSVLLKYTYRPETAPAPVLHDAQGRTFLPLNDIAQFYGAQMTFDSQTRRVTLSKGRNQVKLVLSQPVYLTADPEASYPIDPVEVVSGQVAVQPETAEDLFGTILNLSVRYMPDQQALVAGGIKMDDLKKEILEVRRASAPLPPVTATPQVQASLPTPTPGEEPLSAAQGEEEEGPGLTTPSGIPLVARVSTVPSDQRYLVRRVIIDPGHGGRDIGARGHDKKYFEKQATLDIGKRVAEILRKDGRVQVYMTRSVDKYITLKYRTEFANRHNGDLFISIHCNSNPKSLATGTETYVYSARPSSKVALVEAMSENQGRDSVSSILADMYHSRYTNLSFEFAKKVDDRIRERLKQHIRRVQHAPFYVLRQVDMPAILFETAFISNPKEEMKLKDPKWRNDVAESIADGILGFRDLVEKGSDDREARR